MRILKCCVRNKKNWSRLTVQYFWSLHWSNQFVFILKMHHLRLRNHHYRHNFERLLKPNLKAVAYSPKHAFRNLITIQQRITKLYTQTYVQIRTQTHKTHSVDEFIILQQQQHQQQHWYIRDIGAVSVISYFLISYLYF